MSKPQTSAETQQPFCEDCSYAQSKGEPYGPPFCDKPWCATQYRKIHRQPAATQPEATCLDCGHSAHKPGECGEGERFTCTCGHIPAEKALREVDASTSTAAPELKSCPSCGKSEAGLAHVKPRWSGEPMNVVLCPCGWRTGAFANSQHAREQWNRRADAAPRLTPEQARERIAEVVYADVNIAKCEASERLIDRITTELLRAQPETGVEDALAELREMFPDEELSIDLRQVRGNAKGSYDTAEILLIHAEQVFWADGLDKVMQQVRDWKEANRG